MTNQTPDKNPNLGMPKWLLYGLIGKGVFIVVVVAAVLIYVNSR